MFEINKNSSQITFVNLIPFISLGEISIEPKILVNSIAKICNIQHKNQNHEMFGV